MSVMSLLRRFGKVGIYKFTRDVSGPVRVKGKSVPGKTIQAEVVASIQPATSDEIVEDIGGERNKHYIRIYSSTPLQTADVKTGFKADVITFRDEKFEVLKVMDWTHTHLSLKHYKSFAILQNEIVRKK